ncbi:MAG: SDR family NAD(P)-dependent oxidoreductase, partial [Phenylobacterium sp.]|uniref:SDR family NAD(P)-dependent oxidoreductase n=1 Tax=Phenylobacterium sp. TaxID=1871053 RepID=UPI0030184F9E
MTDILDLGGRVALVTGAGQGVGRQIALHLGGAANSGGVVVNDFVLERAEAVAEEVRAAGGKALALQCDVSNQPAVQDMVAKASSDLGTIGVLVNNAGNAGATPSADARLPFWETGPEVWQTFLGVNLYGVINCTGAVIPGMIERQAPGRIVTIISDASRWGDANMEIYAAGKAGAAGFMRSVARTLGRNGITANSVAIALTDTPAVERTLNGDPERLKRQMEKYIIRRPG